jgi:hypothetical protein
MQMKDTSQTGGKSSASNGTPYIVVDGDAVCNVAGDVVRSISEH